MKAIRFSVIVITIFLIFPMVPVNAISVEYDENNIKPLLHDNGRLLGGRKPSFSYDGKEIVYYAGDPEGNKLPAVWIMNWDGTNRRVLYVNKSIDYDFTGARFSPDGNKIIFSSLHFNYVYNRSEYIGMSINILEKNGTEWNSNCTMKILYFEEEGGFHTPSYNNEGTEIVYESGEIYIMDADGTNHVRVTYLSPENRAFRLYFSPDGSKIVHLRYSDEGDAELWLIDSDGSNEKRLLDDTWYPEYPSFTSDGKILFSSARLYPNSKEVGPWSIWMMDEDGSNKMVVAPTVFNDDFYTDYPSMNPNRTRIVFEHGMGENSGLYYVDDPDGDGIWEDDDNDGIADVIDPDPNTIVTPQTALWAIVIISIGVAVVVIAYVYKKKQKKVVEDKKKVQYCMYCGQGMVFVEEYGKWYCGKCGQYR